MSPYKILGSQISSATPHHNGVDDFVRLNHPTGWVDSYNQDTWVQVDFLAPTKVCRIDSLGRGNHNHFVKTFTLSFSNDAVHYQFYEEDGQLKVI